MKKLCRPVFARRIGRCMQWGNEAAGDRDGPNG